MMMLRVLVFLLRARLLFPGERREGRSAKVERYQRDPSDDLALLYSSFKPKLFR